MIHAENIYRELVHLLHFRFKFFLHVRFVEVDQFRAIIAKYTVPRRFVEWAARVCERFLKEDQKLLESQRTEWRKKYDAFDTELRDLVRLYASEGNRDKSLLSETDYKKQKGNLEQQRQHYNDLLEDNKKNVDMALDLTVKTFEFACNALKCFDEETDIYAKRTILITIGSKWTMNNGIVLCQAKLPFQKIGEGIAATQRLHRPLERKDLRSTESKTILSEHEISIWQPEACESQTPLLRQWSGGTKYSRQ